MEQHRSLFHSIGLLLVIGAGFYLLLSGPATTRAPLASVASTSAATTSIPHEQTAAVVAVVASSTKNVEPEVIPRGNPPIEAAPQSAAPEAQRVEKPYDTAPLPGEQLNSLARSALVNILCVPRSGTLAPISGSGVIVDPRGVILTNAHVAQYVLLSQDPRVDLSCTIRMGAPATALYLPHVLYLPPAWVRAHASDIAAEKAISTGEYDYAFLLITGAINGTTLPATFPYVQIDTREAIGFKDDGVLIASYPAGFIGGITTTFNLYPASSASTIRSLHTFGSGSVDIFSVGGVIGAQSGSSGGEVLNPWGRLIGLIVTMTDGATTADRNLHALSLAYVDRNLVALTGSSLSTTLSGDIYQAAQQFNAEVGPGLTNQLIEKLKR